MDFLRQRCRLCLYILALQSALADMRTQVEYRKRLLAEYKEFELRVAETLTGIYRKLGQETCEAGDPGCEAQVLGDPLSESVDTLESLIARVENVNQVLKILLPVVIELTAKNSPALVPFKIVNLELSSTTAFSCDSDGTPISLCLWEHYGINNRRDVVLIDGNRTDYNGSVDGVSFKGEGRLLKGGKCWLQIPAVQLHDLGRWSCGLISQAGHVFVGEVIVGVAFSKRSAHVPQETVTARLNTTLDLSCKSPPELQMSLCFWERTAVAVVVQPKIIIAFDQQIKNGSHTSVDRITYSGEDGLKNGKCGLRIRPVSELDSDTVWTCTGISQNGTVFTADFAVVVDTSWAYSAQRFFTKLATNVKKTVIALVVA